MAAILFDQPGIGFDSSAYTFDGVNLHPPATDTSFVNAAFASDSRASYRTWHRVSVDQPSAATYRE